jgi:Ca-activated chloride channel family protein
MTFSSPFLLLTLLIVPLAAVGWWWAQRRRMRYAVSFTNLDVLASVVERSSRWRRLVPVALALLALASLCVATARPRVTVRGTRSEGTVILLVDVSRSMVATDVKPTRLGAARQAIRLFLGRLPSRFAVGIVAFSTEASVVSPISTDRNATRQAIDYLLPESGTAIGDGIAEAVNVGRAYERTLQEHAGDPPPVTILMLSDGAQRNGVLLPAQGAQRAKQAGMRIYTVALGTPNGTLQFGFGSQRPPQGFPNGFGFGRSVPVPPDPNTLRAIANDTGGQFFAARDAKSLKAAYSKLGSRLGRKPGKTEITWEFLIVAAALLVGAGLLSSAWSPRRP